MDGGGEQRGKAYHALGLERPGEQGRDADQRRRLPGVRAEGGPSLSQAPDQSGGLLIADEALVNGGNKAVGDPSVDPVDGTPMAAAISRGAYTSGASVRLMSRGRRSAPAEAPGARRSQGTL